MESEERDKWIAGVKADVKKTLKRGENITHAVDRDGNVTFFINPPDPPYAQTFNWRDKAAAEAALEILSRYRVAWGGD